LGQDLLVFGIEIREIFQPRLGMNVLDIRDALTLRDEKNYEAAKQQDHHQTGNDHGA
jgi:hypothetical protein